MSKAMGTIVSFHNVSKDYKSNWSRAVKSALVDISFDIHLGESIGFIGHNGAGKSSTIRLILGLQRPTSGLVRLRGLDPFESKSRRRVAYLPENPFLYDYLTPLEFLEMGAKMHAVSTSDLRRHCMNWLARFGVLDVADKAIRTFSKGMMQRTALAHALCCDPEFLILDEPLSGLDPVGRKEVVDILQEFRGSGRTIFFSSHVLSDVEWLADRFMFIHDGRLRAVCSTAGNMESDSDRYEIVVEGTNALDGYKPLSARLWMREVSEQQLTSELDRISQLRPASHLYSVKTKRSLERAYLEFVSDAERVGQGKKIGHV